MPAPRRALPTSVRAQKCGMVMSVTTQIIFPYMSDARAPAMDVHMTPQDAGIARSFWLILSALLMGDDRYSMERPETISLQPCTKRRGPQAAFLCSIEMPSFLCMISMHTMQNIETLFDKCPRCRLKKCQASSGWSAA